jgi:DUF4097 and DUF4098 domain-containing protein YvlB
MPTFPTPEPITATIEVVAGSVRLIATDRDDTDVEIRPRDPSRASDVRAAEQARVDFHNGTLTVTAGRKFISLGRGGAVHIDVALPSGSRLRTSTASAEVHAEGEYCDARLASASGNLSVDCASGKLKADTASGDIAVRTVKGSAMIASASGDASIDTLLGDVRFRSASGGLSVGRLDGDVDMQTASGAITVANGVRGRVSVQTGIGDIEFGIAAGTAAQLDVRTRSGAVHNSLNATDGPVAGDETMAVHVRTGSGDITVHRAAVEALS